jgi:hypothetical protein
LEPLVRKAIDLVPGLFNEESNKVIAALSNTPIRLSVVSPLAEGADRLVARLVLEREGAVLDVPLPLVKQDYLEDFGTQASKDEFESMLALCPRPMVLRKLPLAREFDPDQLKPQRRRAYLDVGRYVVDNCDVLIALWDGLPARGTGGTAQIVEHAKGQGRPVIRVWRDEAGETCAVLHQGSGLDASAAPALDRFNRIDLTPQEVAKAERTYGNHFPKDLEDLVPEPIRAAARDHLVPAYARASSQAFTHQSYYFRSGFAVYALAAAAVACVAVAELAHLHLFFVAELIVLAVAFLLVKRSLSKRAHEVWLEGRFLAERLRSGLYLAACGVEVTPMRTLPYMADAHRADDWMVRAFEEVWRRVPALDPRPPLLAFIVKDWIGGQIAFHVSKARREGGRDHRLRRAAEILFWTTILCATAHCTWRWFPEALSSQQWVEKLLTFFALVLPAVVAALAGIRSHREHFRLHKRSQTMEANLKDMERRAKSVDPADFERFMREMDELTLRETQEWIMLMRHTHFEVG